MTIEDFFTITELKDGLTTPTRVNDLLTVIQQNQNENNVTNVTEATRQWSAVANTIAATENKECLDLFIQLDGLRFINKWLNDAQNLVNDTGNGSLEDLVIALLRVVDRLQVDHHQSVGSGVGLTVQGLVGHSSLAVREMAQDLCDKWAPVQNVDGPPTDVNSVDEEKVEKETDKEEIVTQEVVMESETEIIKVENENDKFKSESSHLMETSGHLEDGIKNLEVDSLTIIWEDKTLTSNTAVDHHVLESATKTETIEDKTDKDEVITASGVGDSASGGDGGLQEPRGGTEKPKSSSDSESDEEDEKKEVGMESDDDSGSHSPLSKRSMKSQNDDLISKRPSDMELDYGMVDPLELARQVANEVELDVDSQEQSCSTSTNVNEPQSTGGPGHEVSSEPRPEPSPKGSPMNGSETLDKPELNPEKGFSGFDLNEEVSSDETETDHLTDPRLTPISVVSASKATSASDGPPVPPLQFEGTLGLKGPAATSAFRRILEGEKTISPSSSNTNSNQRLEFDLNVSEGEGGEDKTQDFLSHDKIEDASRLQLDLNSLGDSDASIITLDWKRDNRVTTSRTQNGPQSSSTSSSMQPSFTNVDLNLNDHLTAQNNASFNNPFLSKLLNNKRDESVISIFGTQVEVNRNDNIPPHQPNGRFLETSVDFNLGRPGSSLGLGSSMPYSNLPAYGYNHNGFTMGPMYGPPGAPIPYMVDSRGTPIIPPIQPIQPMQPIPTAFSQPTQPFFYNMAATGAPSGSNGAGPSLDVNTLGLNSGFITERGNRENNNNGNLRQFFNNNQASSSSVIGRKREQPDSGWELFPTNFKHHQQPPWQ